MRLVIYTTAPEILDGTETRPGSHAGFNRRGEPVRTVQIALEVGVQQVQRYLEAGAEVWTPNEWALAVERCMAYDDGVPAPRQTEQVHPP